MLRRALGIAVIASLVSPAIAFAQGSAPTFVPVQGVLTDDQGTPIEGSVELTFSLYDSETAVTPLHTETQSVELQVGRFVAFVGKEGSLDLSLFNDYGTLFLGLKVGADLEMAPRLAMGSVPYAGFAQFSGDAQTLAGRASTDYRVATDKVDWADVANVPTTVTATDTLASLSCNSGDVAQYTGSAWTCAPAGASGGDITEVTANAGLTGGGVAGGVALGVDPTYVQRRVGSCGVGSSIRAVAEDGTPTCEADDVGVTGSGSANYLALFTAAGNVGNSGVYQDSAGNIGIGTTTLGSKLTVVGDTATTGNFIELNGGYGVRSGKMPAGNDLDNAREIGFYLANDTSLHKPAGAAGFGAVITANMYPNTRSQLFMNAQPGAGPGMWMRQSATWADDNQWQAWVRVISEDYSGNVGIGTAGPATRLDVRGASAQNTYDVPDGQEDLRVLSSNNRALDGGIITLGGAWGPTAYIKSAARNGMAGDLVFGTRRGPSNTTMTAGMVLDVNGNVGLVGGLTANSVTAGSVATGGDYYYTASRTRYYSVSLVGERGANTWSMWGAGAQCSAGDSCDNRLAVNLPDRAVVTALRLWGNTTATAHDLVAGLYRKALNSASAVAMVAVASTDAQMTLSSSSVSSANIDNSNYSYFLMLRDQLPNAVVYVDGIRIDYTVDGPE